MFKKNHTSDTRSPYQLRKNKTVTHFGVDNINKRKQTTVAPSDKNQESNSSISSISSTTTQIDSLEIHSISSSSTQDTLESFINKLRLSDCNAVLNKLVDNKITFQLLDLLSDYDFQSMNISIGDKLVIRSEIQKHKSQILNSTIDELKSLSVCDRPSSNESQKSGSIDRSISIYPSISDVSHDESINEENENVFNTLEFDLVLDQKETSLNNQSTNTSSNMFEIRKNKIDSESEKINKMIAKLPLDDNQAFYLGTGQKANSLKLYSMGYSFNVNRPSSSLVRTAAVVYWLCDIKGCNGRAITRKLQPPVTHTQGHNHKQNPIKVDEMKFKELVKEKAAILDKRPSRIIHETLREINSQQLTASLSKYDTLRKVVDRVRLKKLDVKMIRANTLSQLEIPREYQVTEDSRQFLLGDSGNEDPNRTIVFATKKGLEMLNSSSCWLADGTFDLAPSFFKQIYSIHCIRDGRLFPCVFTLLPNKKQTTYKKMLRILSPYITNKPSYVNCDYEMAAINAFSKSFNCDIGGCFFHYSQSIYRRIQVKGLSLEFLKSETFRLSYQMLQALAFVHPADVVSGFEIVKLQSPSRFAPIISYFESNYVGRLKKGVRAKPRFAIKYWNVFNRVQDGLPRTTNAVEGWHRKLGAYGNKHLSVVKVLDMFRQEESEAINKWLRVLVGKNDRDIEKRVVEKNNRLAALVKAYDKKDLKNYILGVALVLGENDTN